MQWDGAEPHDHEDLNIWWRVYVESTDAEGSTSYGAAGGDPPIAGALGFRRGRFRYLDDDAGIVHDVEHLDDVEHLHDLDDRGDHHHDSRRNAQDRVRGRQGARPRERRPALPRSDAR
ncbi:MAG: hypothetical protein R2715_20080 [Ilumatobacteraceae bacterium]